MKVWIVSFDNDRKRDLFWVARYNRFSYYEEAGTVFDSEEDARIYAKYQGIDKPQFRASNNGKAEP